MFTGLVEEVGAISSIGKQGEAMVLRISAAAIMSDLKLGDSIAVNGVCLTVTSIGQESFTADVMPQTYRHSNLKNLRNGSKVNLERAMMANGRFGGHIVQGHVDGIGTVKKVTRDQNSVLYDIYIPDRKLYKYVIPQGSITIDGVSLTVVRTEEGNTRVSIIPHTLSETILADKHAGDMVNIECDIIGKYVMHLLNAGREEQQSQTGNESGISLEFLAQNGFA